MFSNPVMLFVVGGVFLVGGAELLVRGSSRLALAAGISPLVVGLTIVAFGTSSPELAVTVGSAFAGEADVALGNVVGSNIFNILFILGLAALIRPLVVAEQLVRLDVPLLIGVSIVVLGMGLDGQIGRIDGSLLTIGLVTYTVLLVLASRREQTSTTDSSTTDTSTTDTGTTDTSTTDTSTTDTSTTDTSTTDTSTTDTGTTDQDGSPDTGSTDEYGPGEVAQTAGAAATADATIGPTSVTARSGPVINVVLVVVGLGLLVLGSRWLVSAAVDTAGRLGVSELVIGLTIVAVGTSLPEVATSVLAAVRGERDIAVGNAVGSCLFNLLGVLGVGSLVAPGGIGVPDGALTFDLPIMIAVAIAALPVLFTGYAISRLEGAVFLGYYLAYSGYLVLEATDHGASAQLGLAIAWFVLPLTILTLVVGVVRAIRGTPPTWEG